MCILVTLSFPLPGEKPKAGIPRSLSSSIKGVPVAFASIITISGSQYSYSLYAVSFNSGKFQRPRCASSKIR